MDLTNCFQQIVSDRGNFSINNDTNNKNVNNNNSNIGKSSILNTKLCELVASVTYMRDYLISNKKDYINI